MIIFPDTDHPKLHDILHDGAIGVIKTDTLYGLVGRAEDEKVVEKIYSVKHRDTTKPLIVLVADETQLFDPLPAVLSSTIDNYWPGPNSIIFESPSAPKWLRRSGSTVAYRMPANENLKRLLLEVGPLVAPSANREGEPPLEIGLQAEAYFGDEIDFIVDGGLVLDGQPSHLYHVTSGGDMEKVR